MRTSITPTPCLPTPLVSAVASILHTTEEGGLRHTSAPLIRKEPAPVTQAAFAIPARVNDYAEDLDTPPLPLRTRAEVAELLRDAWDDTSEASASLVGEARKFPDIAQAPQAAMPAWCVSQVRKSAQDPLSSRYVFVPGLAAAPSEGVYHIEVLHGGATITVSRTSRFQDRILHDPIQVTPEEFEQAAFGFLKTYAYLQDPVQRCAFADLVDTPEHRVALATHFLQDTDQAPFGPTFGVSPRVPSPESPEPAKWFESSAPEPVVTYRRRRGP